MIIRRHILRFNAQLRGHVLFPISCTHFGSINFFRKQWEQWKRQVLSIPNALFTIVGDVTEDDRPTTRERRHSMFQDRREAFVAEDKTHLRDLDTLVLPELSFLNASNCLGLLDGDHYRIYSNGLSSVQYICSQLKVPYLGNGQAIVTMTYADGQRPRASYSVHLRHGRGFNSKAGGVVNRNWNFADQFPSGIDAFIRGHSHSAHVVPKPAFDYDSRELKLRDKETWLINCGSFRGNILMNKTDYPEDAEYGNTSRRQAALYLKLCRSYGDYAVQGIGGYVGSGPLDVTDTFEPEKEDFYAEALRTGFKTVGRKKGTKGKK